MESVSESEGTATAAAEQIAQTARPPRPPRFMRFMALLLPDIWRTSLNLLRSIDLEATLHCPRPMRCAGVQMAGLSRARSPGSWTG